MSHSHRNATKSTLWASDYPDTLSASAFGTSIQSRASWSQNETPTSVQMEDSDCIVDETFLKEVDPTKGGGIWHRTATLPAADMSSPRNEWYSIQEFENLEACATINSAEFTPQGSSPQILPLETLSTGTPIPSSPLSPITPIPITSPALPATSIPLATASPKKMLGESLQSLLETNQGSPPGAHGPHSIDAVHGGLIVPKLPPPEPYEFREMTLGCRFGTPLKVYITIPIMLT
jgi:hypothetical protein